MRKFEDLVKVYLILIRQWGKLDLKQLEKRCRELKVHDDLQRIRKKVKKSLQS